MKTCFSNSTVSWNEFEITRRENLIREIPILLFQTWRDLNPMVKIERCETPIITPENKLQSHIDSNFNLLSISDWPNDARELEHLNFKGILRPETTAGTYEIMAQKFPMADRMKKYLPYCLWQAGISFRNEVRGETMRATKLRLTQFYQMEFQLFASQGTMAPYLEMALESLIKQYGGKIAKPVDIPHYSEKTIDWMINDLEVAGLSIRKDWPHGMVFEVSIGLDRLVALQCSK
jgi:hypothetical protein